MGRAFTCSWVHIGLVLASLALAHAGSSGRRSGDLRERGADDAINACSRLLAAGQDKGKALAVLYRNRCAAWNGKREADRAIADCNEAIRLDANYVAAYLSRGEAWRSKGANDQAVNDYGQAIKLDAKSAPAYAGRCFAFANKRDNDRALTDCNEAIRLDPKHAPAYAARCYAWHNKQDGGRALPDCDQAIRLDPNHYLGYGIRGVVHAEKRDYDRAIADYDQAITAGSEVQVGLPQSRRGLARQARARPRHRRSRCQAIRLDPNAANAYHLRGLDAGRQARPRRRHRRLWRGDPPIPNTVATTTAASWLTKRDYDRAIADYGEAIRLNPKYARRSAAAAGRCGSRGARPRHRGVQRGHPPRSEIRLRLQQPRHHLHGQARLRARDRRLQRVDPPRSDLHGRLHQPGAGPRAQGRHARARAPSSRRRSACRRNTTTENGRTIPRASGSPRCDLPSVDRRVASGRPGDPAPVRVAEPGPGRPAEPGPRASASRCVIGNANYPDADPPLKQPAQDARLLADELKASGFEVERGGKSHQAADAARRSTGSTPRSSPARSALIYFSGYRHPIGPAELHDPGQCADLDRARRRARRHQHRIGARRHSRDGAKAVKLVIIDASRRNPFERRFRSASAGLAPIIAPTQHAGDLGRPASARWSTRATGKNSLFMTRVAQGDSLRRADPGGGVQPGAHRRVARQRGRAGAMGLVDPDGQASRSSPRGRAARTR